MNLLSKVMDRRAFITRSSALAAASMAHPFSSDSSPSEAGWFNISLAEWSLHRSIFSGRINPLDFPVLARRAFGVDAVEYVNAFFLPSDAFVTELKRRAEGEGVRNLLIMVDEAGRLGDADDSLRRDAVQRHKPWLDAASALGCHSIRVNARSDGSAEEQMKLMADGLHRLAEEADARGLNVLIENHGGFSSHGNWVAGLMRAVDHPRVGTLPDFGNWYPEAEYGGPPEDKSADVEYYDRYKGVDEMMAFAKGVSAKSYAFDANGNETSTDFNRMLGLVKNHGFDGYVGIEYEGNQFEEGEGIFLTKQLLERVREATAG